MAEETFGNLLRSERQDRGLGVEAVAETLGVNPAWLRALEANDFGSLPDEATMRECLYRYADCLDVDAKLMLADYDRDRERFLRTAEVKRQESRWEKPSTMLPEKLPGEPPVELSVKLPRKLGEKLETEPGEPPAGRAVRPVAEVPLRPIAIEPEHRPRIWVPFAALIAVTLVAAAVAGLLAWRGSSREGLQPAPKATPEATAAPSSTAGRAPAHPGTAVELDAGPIGPAARAEPPAEVTRVWASPAGVAPSEVIPPEVAPSEVAPSEVASSGVASSEVAPAEVIPPDATTTEPAATEVSAPDAQAAPSPARQSRMAIAEHGVGTGVEERRLVGEGDRFPAGSRVWYWTRVLGARASDTIDHVWLRDGAEAARISLRVGGPSWRTFSSITLPESALGSWAVEVRDESGDVLARREFQCIR